MSAWELVESDESEYPKEYMLVPTRVSRDSRADDSYASSGSDESSDIQELPIAEELWLHVIEALSNIDLAAALLACQITKTLYSARAGLLARHSFDIYAGEYMRDKRTRAHGFVRDRGAYCIYRFGQVVESIHRGAAPHEGVYMCALIHWIYYELDEGYTGAIEINYSQGHRYDVDYYEEPPDGDQLRKCYRRQQGSSDLKIASWAIQYGQITHRLKYDDPADKTIVCGAVDDEIVSTELEEWMLAEVAKHTSPDSLYARVAHLL
jgi:hypothetical protein